MPVAHFVVLFGLRCNRHSLLLNSYFSRINRTKNPSCSARDHSIQDTSHLFLHCPATDSWHRFLFGGSFSTASGPGPGELPGFWGTMVFRQAPVPPNDRVPHHSQKHQQESLKIQISQPIYCLIHRADKVKSLCVWCRQWRYHKQRSPAGNIS